MMCTSNIGHRLTAGGNEAPSLGEGRALPGFAGRYVEMGAQS